MIVLKELPKAAAQRLAERGLDVKTALLTMRADLGSDLVLKDVYVALFADRLCVLEGSVVISRPSRLRLADARDREAAFAESKYTEYEKEKLTEVHVETLVSSGLAVGKYDGVETELFRFTNTCRHDANVLCDAYGSLLRDGKVDEEKFRKETEANHYCPKCGMRYPDPERKVCPKCMDKVRLVKRLGGMFVRYRGYIAMVMFTFVMITALGVLTPYISNTVFYDDVLTEGGRFYGEIGKMVLLIVGVRIVSLLVSLVNGIISAKVAAELVYDLKKTIFNAISSLSLSFFSNRQTGGLMTQVNNDATTIYWFFCDGFPYFVTNALQFIVVLVIMFATDWLLTLYTFITVPLFFLCFKLAFAMFDKLHAKAYSRRRSFNSLISDVLNGMRVVKSFARETEERERFERRSVASAQADTDIGVQSNTVFRAMTFLMRIGSVVVWGVGGWQVMQATGEMSYGTLMAFIAYVNMIYGPIEFFADAVNWWAECLNALQRLFEIRDAVPEVRECAHPVTPEHVRGDVEFRSVCFSYVENRQVLEDISFTVPAGSTLGIVGHTGAGKSTIANLLTRLYDPKSGEVLIDGINLRELSFAALHGMIAIVSQETYLFRGTIMENIRYARPDAANEEVVNAAKIASAHDFIIKYPDGYETMVGFGHKDLSGGERQRISIARAVLKDPSILILDEATAAMDTQTERQIQSALNRLTENRTTIIIAHRLSTLRDADRLIVIENGKMPEAGTAVELLEKKGVYYKLYKMQAEALKTIGIEE